MHYILWIKVKRGIHALTHFSVYLVDGILSIQLNTMNKTKITLMVSLMKHAKNAVQ